MADPEPTSRRDLRNRSDGRSSARRAARGWGAALAALIVVGSAATAIALVDRGGGGPARMRPADALPEPARATSLPVPAQSSTPIAPPAPCEDPAVVAALAGGGDAEVIAAFGGAEAFRAYVAAGSAPCVDLADATRTWVVVDKLRPLRPIDYVPSEVVRPEGMQRTADVRLRPEPAAALTALVAAAAGEGAGVIGLNSAYRSYESQTRIYGGYVSALGWADADLQSARPGYSEHQTGLAADVAACDGGCGTLHAFGGTAQAAWVAENAWRFGYIVRYPEGATATTGYMWEPWHLRYIGPDLARAYREGGFATLEDFFGLPPAPDYDD